MSKIVAVHGIGQQFKGEHILHAEWRPAVRDGLIRVGEDLPNDDDLACAFYGDLFRKKGTKGIGNPPYNASDITEEWERRLLEAWWREAARIEPQVPGSDAKTKLRTPYLVQRALNALSQSRYFTGVAEKAMIGDLKQVYLYFHDEIVRNAVQSRLAQVIKADTLVMIGHSLGSIVAYEALCNHPEWPIHTLITLGSPLGVRHLIFDQLRPPPTSSLGTWPGPIRYWTNIADGGDVVALVKTLRPQFGNVIQDKLIYNGATAHCAHRYLTAEETGHAIAAGLTT